MKFTNPDMLFLLWVLMIVIGFTIYGRKKHQKILLNFASKTSLNSIAPTISFKRKWLKGFLIVFALLFLCFSISGPLIGFKWKKIEQKGVDIMIALDCSRSMLCQDIKPSRLKRAKREIVDLLRIIESDRAGLVAFAGEAILQCPLTLDRNAFNVFLDVLEPDYLPVGGTDIAGAIEICLKSFEKETNSSKAIILITDGEETANTLDKKAAKKALQNGVKIFCIGMGTEDGAPIPDKNGGFKKDKKGDVIISKMDEQGLKELAHLGNGKYVSSVTGDMDLNAIYSQGIMENMEKKTLKSFRQKVWENRYQWFLLPCIILLFIELIVSGQKKSNSLIIIITLVLSSLNINPATSHAGIINTISIGSDVKQGIKAYEGQDYKEAEKKFIDAQLKDPDNAEHYYNIGTSAYKNQDYESALNNFQKALESKDAELKHKTMFNIGNSQYRQGMLEDAIKTFEKLIQNNPSDKLAKKNLEFIKTKLEKQKEQEQQDKDKNNNQNKDDEEKDKDNNEKDKDKSQSQEKNNSKDKDKKDEIKQPENQQEQEKNNKPEKPVQAKQENNKKDKEEATQTKQNMLNRLSDKPGKAMMQTIQQRQVEKDW